ncbi:hypothetical protein [Segnochrobactrum spirostomi]|uniref:hypothetical protein n=1 Tax=Segnochrobactrum spirostomi TaxID=2608987 RepID=UPI0028ADB8EB|nr:hypothetical protein [Segnochrobactrum spirostomi]
MIEPGREVAVVVAIYTVIVGLLMVSSVPTFSGKKLGSRIRRDLVLPLFVVVVLIVALVVSYPFEMLSIGAIVYLLAIPVGVAAWRRLAAATPDIEVDEQDA